MRHFQLHYPNCIKFALCALLILIPLTSTQMLEAAADGGDVTQGNGATNVIYLPTVYNGTDASCVAANNSHFGVQMYSNTSSSSKYFSDIVCSGASWVRSDLDWKRVEPENTTPANYNWATADASAGAARDAGLNMILTLEEAPEWAATSTDGPLKPGMNAELAEFMKAVVERYDGDGVDDAPGIVIRHFEIYNEPDAGVLGSRIRWGNDGDKYAEMLSVVYPAIKEASSEANVLLGGMAYDWFTDWTSPPFPPGPFVRNFLTDVLDNGGGDYFDIFAFHQYPSFAPAWTTDGGIGLVEKTAVLKEIMTTYGIADKQIMVTESGTNNENSPGIDIGGDEYQARHVAALFTQALVADIDVLIWFSMFDLPDYEFFNGLVMEDATDKPSMTAFKTAITQLGNATFTRQLSDDETGAANIDAYQFSVPANNTLYVAWVNSIILNTPGVLRIPASQATLIDLYGELTSVTDADDGIADGQITVNLTGQPKYILVTQ